MNRRKEVSVVKKHIKERLEEIEIAKHVLEVRKPEKMKEKLFAEIMRKRIERTLRHRSPKEETRKAKRPKINITENESSDELVQNIDATDQTIFTSHETAQESNILPAREILKLPKESTNYQTTIQTNNQSILGHIDLYNQHNQNLAQEQIEPETEETKERINNGEEQIETNNIPESNLLIKSTEYTVPCPSEPLQDNREVYQESNSFTQKPKSNEDTPNTQSTQMHSLHSTPRKMKCGCAHHGLKLRQTTPIKTRHSISTTTLAKRSR
ncbi:hypothetical protein NEOKW01_0176 [Nematocida sp. AWRm80]|nr:hypothetical protein NEOKW01_0176 [Nematocida sp. AWRm80]